MPDNTVYRQTAKGQRELAARTSALAPGLAKLLSMFDGKTAVDDLRPTLGRVDDTKLRAAIAQLIRNGYLELAGGAPAVPPMPKGPITLDFTIVAKPSAPSSAPKAEAKPAAQAAPPVVEDDNSELDLSQELESPAPPPSPEQIAHAEQLTLAGMRTLNAAGYYVNILSKPGIRHPPRSGTRYTVLLLDHDKQNALLVARALMLAEFDVRNAENRDQALTEMRKVPLPDAIVLNLQMPELNGINLLARLQQHEYYASVPVVVITDDHAHDTVVDALARGAAGYMTQPFKQEALLDTVRAVLGLT